MRILVNERIRHLFIGIGITSCIFILCLQFLLYPHLGILSWLVLSFSIIFCVVVFGLLIRYFKKQDQEIETAVSQIHDFLAGNKEARIDCDKEGELYRLFTEVNNMGAVLSAHVENEGREKEFLKNTISDISHQLKTPLAALSIYNGLLQESDNLTESQEIAGQSEKEIDRIHTLVQNLLKITKLDAGTIILNKQPEKLAEIMKDIELHYEYRAKTEQKQLEVSGAEDILFDCDRDWLMEAVDNLVKNAFDHTNEGNVIKLEWKKLSETMLQIRVEDNGSGIHEEDIHYIFKRFYRSRYSQDTQGIGLGLPLAKAIIEDHGGTIEVDSTLGKGTTFLINFWIPTEL